MFALQPRVCKIEIFGRKMKDFIEQLNDLIAPVTHAWGEPEIQSVVVDHGGRTEKLHAMLNEDEILVVVIVKLKRVTFRKVKW